MKFAFVYWLGDPEPKCWQVISTTAIKAQDGQPLKEGETYDAEWKADEETSPAKIIKLGDNKNYLKQFMHHEYVDKWIQEQSKPQDKKRKAKPKQLSEEFIVNGADSDSEAQPDNNTSSSSKVEKKRKEDNNKLEAPKEAAGGSSKNKKQKKKEELEQLKEKNAEVTKSILSAASTSAATTVAEARENEKRKSHPQFGGKCPKDIHAECKKKIEELKKEIEELKEKLKEKSTSCNESNSEKLPDDIPKYGKIPRSVGMALNWKEISPGIWMDSMTLNACLRSCSSKTHFARTLLDKFFPDINGKRLNEVDSDIVEAIVDLALMSKFKSTKEETRGSIKQSLRKKCNQLIFQSKRPDYFREKQKERRDAAKRKSHVIEDDSQCSDDDEPSLPILNDF